MDTFKIGICEPEDFSEKAISELQSIGEVEQYKGTDLKGFIKDKKAIFVRLKYLINDEFISDASKLQFICSPTTGLNHIQIERKKVSIISLKGEYDFLNTIRATPEHVFGLTLSLLRNYSHAFLNEQNSLFDRNLYRGYELYNNNVGIIGLGRVGNIIAKYFTAFDSKVRYYDIDEKDTKYALKCKTLDELIESSNIIILCANYIPQNHEFINDYYLNKMKNKYFINAARGELVDEKAFLLYLKQNWFKGVAIDVISNETSKSSFLKEILPLTKETNLIVTPHIGGATFNSMTRTEEFIAEKLINIIK